MAAKTLHRFRKGTPVIVIRIADDVPLHSYVGQTGTISALIPSSTLSPIIRPGPRYMVEFNGRPSIVFYESELKQEDEQEKTTDPSNVRQTKS